MAEFWTRAYPESTDPTMDKVMALRVPHLNADGESEDALVNIQILRQGIRVDGDTNWWDSEFPPVASVEVNEEYCVWYFADQPYHFIQAKAGDDGLIIDHWLRDEAYETLGITWEELYDGGLEEERD